MLIAGLTGGMGCGKSFVARALADLGCHVIEADELGHEVLLPGGDAFAPVVAAFGPGILDAEGRIGRAALAARVFGHPGELAKLNAIVHPAVRGLAMRRMREIGARDPHAVIVYVAAILFESGAYRDVGKVIVVSCTREQQIARSMERPGATEADVLARLERQMPLEEKKKRADYLIDTSGTKEDTLRQTRLVWEDLKRQA
ncbi:MAG TPA: dephospho-CoA kinase [Bryobacteraceae bacterium]|nr:dephospho-CoA kinase [Bryobacteraceae bacterium]